MWPPSITALLRPETAKPKAAIADRHIPADARQKVDAAIASIQLNGRVRAYAIPEIYAWIAAHLDN